MWHCGTSELAALHWIVTLVIFLQHQHCYDPDRQSPHHLVSLIDGSCEVHQEQQNCFSKTSPALVWLRHLETEYLTLHGRGSSFCFHCFPTFQPLSFFSLRLILCISGLEAVFCSIGRFAKSPPVLNSSSLDLI